LAHCRQTGHVQGYITAFRKIALAIDNMTDAEAKDKFVRGLKP
jgi:hypothetical protein